MSFFFFLKGPSHKGTVSPAAQPEAPYCVAPFELIMFRGLLVIGGEGRGWLDSFVSCQPGSNLARAICLYPEEGWRLHSTAQQRSFSASQPVCLYLSLSLPLSPSRSLSLSLSLSFPLRSALRSASLHTAWPSTLFTLPAKWSLSGLSIWLISVILPAFLCKKLDNLIWPGKRRNGGFIVCVSLMFCHCNWLILSCSLYEGSQLCGIYSAVGTLTVYSLVLTGETQWAGVMCIRRTVSECLYFMDL